MKSIPEEPLFACVIKSARGAVPQWAMPLPHLLKLPHLRLYLPSERFDKHTQPSTVRPRGAAMGDTAPASPLRLYLPSERFDKHTQPSTVRPRGAAMGSAAPPSPLRLFLPSAILRTVFR